MKQDVIYIEHSAGDFEDNIQVCVNCGKVLVDYTGHWVSDGKSKLTGWPRGPVYVTGTNPVQTTTERPKENYGPDDPYIRKVLKCVGDKNFSELVKDDEDQWENDADTRGMFFGPSEPAWKFWLRMFFRASLAAILAGLGFGVLIYLMKIFFDALNSIK